MSEEVSERVMELDFSAKRNRSLIVLQRLDKNVLEIIAEASIVSM